ncbi:DUF2795 domain-containing protein [Salinicola peritrichatus]|uniref:DUF2795 domain-containing protein n=1 Tax=Salinicola peritrichatus TaxID=1267424 RepID=UPI000DA132BB|nr:DUF2795 domain-containing protein [Salinicola peritrichatus]
MTRGLGGHSPANVSNYLGGIDFPADKQDLVEHAKKNSAESDVMEVIEALPEGQYESMADVMKGVGEVE